MNRNNTGTKNPDYKPRYWENGMIITDEDLNNIEEQLDDLVDGISKIIVINDNDEPPNDPYNQVWIKKGEMHTIPEIEDFNKFCNSFAPTYTKGANYKIGDYVIYNTVLYKCKQNINNAPLELDQEKWIEVYLVDDIINLISVQDEQPISELNKLWLNSTPQEGVTVFTQEDLENIIAPAYSSSSTYALGDYVTNDGKLYYCKMDINTAEEWMDSHWEQVDIGAGIQSLNNNLSVTTGTAKNIKWESGSLFDATGIEYDSPARSRTRFVKVSPNERIAVITDSEALQSLTIYVFEFASNTKTATGTNETLKRSAQDGLFGKWFTVGNQTNYVRIVLKTDVGSSDGHVFIVRPGFSYSLLETQTEMEINEIETEGRGYLHGEFVCASMLHGNIDYNVTSRVSSITKFKFDRDITLFPDPGYSVGVHTFSSDGSTFVADSGWQTEPYTIPKNTYFRIIIKGVDNGLEDLNKCIRAIKVSTIISEINDAVEQNTDDITTVNNDIADVNADLSNIRNAIEAGTSVIASTEWENGSLLDATGIEYISQTISGRTGFIKVSPNEKIAVVADSVALQNLTIYLFEFADNTKSATGSNERLIRSAQDGVFGKWFTVGNQTNYVRIVLKTDVSNLDGHVFVARSSFSYKLLESQIGSELNEIATTGLVYLHGEFACASMSHGNLIYTDKSRVSSVTKFKFNRNITLYPDTGYSIGIHTFSPDGSTFVSDSGWQTAPYTVPKNTYFRIIIKGRDQGFENLYNCIRAVKVSTNISDNMGILDTKSPSAKKVVSGNIVEFEYGADQMPLEQLRISFSPVQSGSGDPSPENVRNIISYTGITLYHSGEDISNPEEIQISWQNQLGYVFGGTYDITAGTMTKKYAEYILNGSSNIFTISQSGDTIRFWALFEGAKFTGGDPYSNMLKIGTYDAREPYTWGFPSNYPTMIFVCLPYGGQGGIQGTTAADIKSWLGQHPIQIVTTLETPVISQFDRMRIESLQGINRLWSSVGGIECTYCVDPTLLINNELPIPIGLKKYEYTGERVNPKYHVACRHMFDLTNEWRTVDENNINRARQGGAVYGDLLFVSHNGLESMAIYNMKTGNHIANVSFGEYDLRYHCNNINFGTERYDENDPLPLLYLSQESGVCLVYRITESDGVYTASLVQTITYPTQLDMHYPNSFVDNDSGTFWVYWYTDNSFFESPTNTFIFTEYNMPKLSDGNIQLNYTNKLSEFSIKNYTAGQGLIVRNGKMYQVSGYGSSDNWFNVNDLKVGKTVTRISLINMGITDEPEATFIWNDHICFYTVFGHVYMMYFD